MIDELDLAFEDQGEKGPSRHRRKKGGGGGGKSAIAFVLVFLLLGALAGGVWYGYDKVKGFFTAADYDGPGSTEVTVQVKKGDTITDIGNTLVEADVVKSAAAFVEAAAEHPQGQNIQEGSYKLRTQMRAKDVVVAMLDRASRITSGVTIQEGLTSFEIYQKVSEKTGRPVEEYRAAAKDPEALGIPDWWFTRDDGQKVTKSIEGFLFPDTYEFDPNATAVDHLRLMVGRFLTVTGEMQFADQSQKVRKITPYEVLTVASLAQAEAGNAEDLGKVARVAYNRIYSGNFPCNCLEFDVGINYYYQLNGKPKKASKDMTRAELYDPKNPYRLHGKEGLPPTPINNPGKQALEGALKPPAGPWLFFVAIDKEGHSAFAATDAEHEKNKALARKNGIL
ncbi:endolytic transglycosylase MltG [Spirilliplanes yamanashiensis]|uniref:Endolytic murein transglycosylase n=1 Tax=Spirilliplanes yamanashiensis TaxID=42233 RepID=A0A8J4DL72_9ACTN|nr:endolytic transglycosylase MltG [Spirilliplanes yamanashiensis]MDP9818627.1 UPF0755 protein [Spirilliplanes yamanashiensis]GIJ05083.1 hypothetical protein Sya03_44350 [Spirilliplanes yamanashiensis]